MKLLILSVSLLVFGQIKAQCVKLYVKAHLDGPPICQLSEGDYIEICEDYNEVNGCPRNFYIYDKGSSYASLTYELSLDKGWSTHYMTLMVNPTTKRFGFILQGQSAIYSYYTEADMEKIRAAEESERIKREQIRRQEEKRKLEADKLQYSVINKLVNEKKFLDAENALKTLHFPNAYGKTELIYDEVRLIKLSNERKAFAVIETLLNEKNTEAAIQKYNSLYLIKDSVEKLLTIRFTQQFADSLIDGKRDNISTFIGNTTNKNLLSKKEDGSYEIIIEQNGQKQNGIENNLDLTALSNNTINYYGFIIPLKTRYTLKISTNTQKVHEDSVRYSFSEKFKGKRLYTSIKGNYYFLNRNRILTPIFLYAVYQPQFIDNKIKKYDINVEHIYESKKAVNGIVISSYKYWEKDNVIKAKKGIGRKILRVSAILSLVPLYIFVGLLG